MPLFDDHHEEEGIMIAPSLPPPSPPQPSYFTTKNQEGRNAWSSLRGLVEEDNGYGQCLEGTESVKLLIIYTWLIPCLVSMLT